MRSKTHHVVVVVVLFVPVVLAVTRPSHHQVAKTKQCIEEEKMQVQVVERAQQILLQEQEITRREMELEATVKKPADAERYRLEKLAEANR